MAFAHAAVAHDAVNANANADPFAWLEEARSPRAMDWVRAHDAATADRFMGSRDFAATRERLLDANDSRGRIPRIDRMGDFLYESWQEGHGSSGTWRRTTLDEYRKRSPRWSVLVDFDRLARRGRAHWVFRGAQCLPPRYRRCLVSLSPGGGDAVEVREFDTARKAFVEGGFALPPAKSSVGWIDEDTVYVVTDAGPGSTTTAGYPRRVRRWKRGTPLSEATEVFSAATTDLAVNASHDATPGFERDFVDVARDYFHFDLYLLGRDGPVRVQVPDDARFDVHREWLLVQPRSPWTTGATTHPAGCLLAIRLDSFMAGDRAFTELFHPDAHTALSGWRWTRHHLLLATLADVRSRIDVLTPGPNTWERSALPDAPALAGVAIETTGPDRDDEYWLRVSGFLTPPVLVRGDLAQGTTETVKREPDLFDATNLEVTQHVAVSDDGTRVPYFQVAPRGMQADGTHPTLLEGYGGFEIAQLPSYDGRLGRGWLQRGGVYVLANIRGGGEYGPAWHQAAVRAGRHRAFEDFAAVARDLVQRRVTSPAHLGALGTSNGGLLAGNMLTAHPDLFGAVVCEFPLLDMQRYARIAAGALWLAEFGDPDTGDWSWLRTLSPYENLRADARYPAALFVTATSDDRVGPGHARKMVAKMEALGLKDAWFYENLEGGHGAGIDDRQDAALRALVYEFLWTKLG